jgi:hypothetical protein
VRPLPNSGPDYPTSNGQVLQGVNPNRGSGFGSGNPNPTFSGGFQGGFGAGYPNFGG